MTIPKVPLPPFVEKIGDGHLAHSQNKNLHTLGKDINEIPAKESDVEEKDRKQS